MHKLCLSALSAVMLASPLAALAQSPDPTGTQTLSSFDDRWYLLPFGTYTWADENRGTDDGWGWGFAVGKPVNEWLNLELRGTYTSLPSDGEYSLPNIQQGPRQEVPAGLPQGDFTIGDIAIDGVFVFNRRGTVQPFLLAGLGGINDDFECDRIPANRPYCNSDSSWSFMAEAGAGIMFRVAEYASVRIDGRYRYDDNSGSLRQNDSFGDWIATAGLVIPIGGRAAPPAKTTRAYELSADALFAFNKSNLSSQGVTTVNNLASDLNKVSYDAVRVAGHTDPIGSDAFNQALSERRAGTVQGQLVTQGVPADRITATGYGESQLKVTPADCASAKSRAALIECFQPNRRVEVTVEGITQKQ
jgi:OmpA-OmpF porin, OOP family